VTDGGLRIRKATPADARAVAEIWHAGWPDGHLGHVPEELVAVRTQESFQQRAGERVADTVVAEVGGAVVGFTMVVDAEVEQVYVDASHRGSGVADALLADAETRIRAAGHPRTWLAVVSGNARARRFYERRGWVDDGPLVYPAEGPNGPIDVPAHRYVKDLT
jgi:ribosomal protein S18 acetylase RimI-like enzyme